MPSWFHSHSHGTCHVGSGPRRALRTFSVPIRSWAVSNPVPPFLHVVLRFPVLRILLARPWWWEVWWLPHVCVSAAAWGSRELERLLKLHPHAGVNLLAHVRFLRAMLFLVFLVCCCMGICLLFLVVLLSLVFLVFQLLASWFAVVWVFVSDR